MDLPTTTPPAPTPPTSEVQLQPKTPTSRGFYWLIGTLVAVILAGAGTWVYVNDAKTTQPADTSGNGSTQSASTPEAATTDADRIGELTTTTNDLNDTLSELKDTLASITSDSQSDDDTSNL